MKSVLLQLTSTYLKYILYILAIWFLLKGHNKPGGGFIAGLLVSSAVLLSMLALGVDKVQKSMKLSPLYLTTSGVLIALFFSVLPIFFGVSFMKGIWLPEFSLPVLGTMHIGTPLFFDIGVFLAVIGFVISVVFDLERAE
jgi:multisubunit Na+/H+ antiporter MnhB subunit